MKIDTDEETDILTLKIWTKINKLNLSCLFSVLLTPRTLAGLNPQLVGMQPTALTTTPSKRCRPCFGTT